MLIIYKLYHFSVTSRRCEAFLCLLVQFEVVLEIAHQVDEIGKPPTRDRITDKLVIAVSDIVIITACNVDLDFATKGKVITCSS